MMYRKLMRLHLWLAMIVATPLVIFSLTGALLVFGHELQAEIAPDEWLASSGPPLPLETLLDRFEEQLPGIPVNLIAMDQPDGHSWKLWLGNRQGVANIDPATGDVLKHYQHNTTAYGYVLQLHRWLLTPEGEMRRWVRHFMAVMALILIIQVVVGAWMWSIPPRRLKRLAIPFDASAKRIVMRLHSVSGLFMASILVLIAFTGISFNWHKPAEAVVSALTFSEVRPPVKLTASDTIGERNLDRAAQAALDGLDGGRLLSVGVPKSNDQPVNVRIGLPDIVNASLVSVDPVTADVLNIQHANDKTRAEVFMGIAYKLHIGDFAGLTVRSLWVLVSLMPAFYVISGIWLYLRRTQNLRAMARERRDTRAYARG